MLSEIQSIRRAGRNSIPAVTLGYLFSIVLAELVAAVLGPFPGAVVDGVVILALLNHYLLVRHSLGARPGEIRVYWAGDIAPIVALLPLLRILSLLMPIPSVSIAYWYALVGFPVLLSEVMVARIVGLGWLLHLADFAGPKQVLIGLTGVPLGLVAYGIVHPKPLVSSGHWVGIGLAAASLALFVGLTEEFLFRGLLLTGLNEVFGRLGLILSALIAASMYLGSHSLLYVLFILVVSLWFGWCVNRTGTLSGVVTAHSLMIVGALLAWPLLLR